MMLRQFGLIAGISTRAFFHERTVSVCTLLGLAAILAPLLVLFGLKFGTVSALRERLARDPRIRVVQPIGQGNYDSVWFADLAGLPETGFVTPTTRFLAATINLRNPARPDAESVSAEMVPTAPGDPLLDPEIARRIAGQPEGKRFEVALSRGVAERLGLAAGQTVDGRLGRTWEGEPEILQLALTAVVVLPAGRVDRDVVLVPPALLLAAEDYREGYVVPAFDTAGQDRPPGERRYASFRLYARTIDDVAPLRTWLAERGVQAVTRIAEIETVQQLDRDLDRLFLVISSLGAAGYLLSLALSLLAAVARQRRALSLLRLIGFSAAAVAFFPAVQGLWAAILSFVAAGLVTSAAVPVVGRVMASQLPPGATIFRLLPEHVAWAAAATILCTLAAASYGGARAAAIPPAEGLRDD
jgi:putative ABC transport system permease protein